MHCFPRAVRPVLLSLCVALTAVGCGSVAPTPNPIRTPAQKSAADQRSATPAALSAERLWLQNWFKDTPVQIRQVDEDTVSIDVPRNFCFDPGSSVVKPALAAVLDKVVESLRRVPYARVSVLAAPDDNAGATPLAIQRATQLRQHLSSRGVAAARLGKPSATPAALVQLRIDGPSP